MCRGPEGRKVELMRSFAVACKSSCRRKVPMMMVTMYDMQDRRVV